MKHAHSMFANCADLRSDARYDALANTVPVQRVEQIDRVQPVRLDLEAQEHAAPDDRLNDDPDRSDQ
jgi:hypothetical protein